VLGLVLSDFGYYITICIIEFWTKFSICSHNLGTKQLGTKQMHNTASIGSDQAMVTSSTQVAQS
jgi:hypothetical protein